ncbi:hypothetical protein ACTFIZ_010759 [Dictyostelium cf. discoideum]
MNFILKNSIRNFSSSISNYSKMTGKVVVKTTNAPGAIGPYSQAIIANNQVFVSGCLGIDKDTMQFTSETDVSIQTKLALTNMKNIVEAAGSSMEKVVKTTILLKSMDDFQAVNTVYSTFFPVDPPARSTFAVACLPKNALVEIEAIAIHQ